VPTIDRDGIAIHYEVHGRPTDGVPLLLTHGYSASTGMWAPNLAALSAERQIIVWDVRGHGQSDSPSDPSAYSQALSVADMAAVLDAAGADRAAIGGLSLGGFLSLAFHLSHPDRVAALLLLDTGPGFKQEAPRQHWNEMAEGYARAFDERGQGALGRSPEIGTGPHDPKGLALAARGILTQHDADVISSLPHITVPTLVLVGARDQPFLAAAGYMAVKIRGAVKVVMADAGHASNIDRPAAFNDAVNTFLAGVDAG
jgi:pimeloyl-ACP methyl ester carboxylesterase